MKFIKENWASLLTILFLVLVGILLLVDPGTFGVVIIKVAGILFTAVGMIAGCFLGALVGELLFGKKELGSSCRSALGAFAGVMAGTGIKLIASITMFIYIIKI